MNGQQNHKSLPSINESDKSSPILGHIPQSLFGWYFSWFSSSNHQYYHPLLDSWHYLETGAYHIVSISISLHSPIHSIAINHEVKVLKVDESSIQHNSKMCWHYLHTKKEICYKSILTLVLLEVDNQQTTIKYGYILAMQSMTTSRPADNDQI